MLDHDGHQSAVGAPDTLASSNTYIGNIMQLQKSHERQSTEVKDKVEEDLLHISSEPPATSTDQVIEAGGSKGPESENAQPEFSQSSALRHYVSIMGKGNLLAFSILVLLHIACSTAQRESLTLSLC